MYELCTARLLAAESNHYHALNHTFILRSLAKPKLQLLWLLHCPESWAVM